MKYMIFRREHDGTYYLFNGEWPIAVSPKSEPWGGPFGTPHAQQIATVEQALPALTEVLNSAKRTFTIAKVRYIVTKRDTFITE